MKFLNPLRTSCSFRYSSDLSVGLKKTRPQVYQLKRITVAQGCVIPQLLMLPEQENKMFVGTMCGVEIYNYSKWQSFGFDTGPQSLFYSFVALSVTHCYSQPRNSLFGCEVVTVVLETRS